MAGVAQPILHIVVASEGPNGVQHRKVTVTAPYETTTPGPTCVACAAPLNGRPAVTRWRFKGLPHRFDFCAECAEELSDEDTLAACDTILARLSPDPAPAPSPGSVKKHALKPEAVETGPSTLTGQRRS